MTTRPDGAIRETVLRRVRDSRKYARVCEALILRLTDAELRKGFSSSETSKRVKRKLHQIAAAYRSSRPDFDTWLERLDRAANKGERKRVLRVIMTHHASTRERLHLLGRFYGEIWNGRPPRSVLDIGCGLNPLASPWMSLPDSVTYTAIDVFEDLAMFLRSYFDLMGIEGSACAGDVIGAPPDVEVDTVLLMKMIPCLEQGGDSQISAWLQGLKAKRFVISFPGRTLGGKGKGMASTYQERFRPLLSSLGDSVRRLPFPSELVFVIDRT